jgi:hypothetical protein
MKTLEHIDGDIFVVPGIQVIGHQANTQNIFGSGIARTIREKFPEAYEADVVAAKTGSNVLGAYSKAEIELINGVKNRRGTDLCRIYNLYGQNLGTDYSKRLDRNTDYEALYSALEGMAFDLKETEEQRMMFDFCREPVVAFPFRMGSDRAKGDWRIVERLIEVAFDGYKGKVLIVHYSLV